LRAKDHKEKRKRLKVLKEKAAFRNPDEFHFGMMSTRTSDGQKIGDRGNKALPPSVVKLLKTQDAGYIRTMLQKTRKERARLEEEIQIAEDNGTVIALKEGSGKDRRRTTYVDSKEEQEAFARLAPDHLDEDEDEDEDGDEDDWEDEEEDKNENLLQTEKPGQTSHQSRRALDAERQAMKDTRKMRKMRLRGQEVRRNLLEAVKEREQDLVTAEHELEMQRAKMNSDIGGVNKNGIKFKIRQRKR
jgi:U3 small nucleolar RNA-associated protein 11